MLFAPTTVVRIARYPLLRVKLLVCCGAIVAVGVAVEVAVGVAV